MILKTLVMVTLLATDLKETTKAYHDHLGYGTVSSGTIDPLCAEQSGHETMGGKNYIIMRPPAGEPEVMLRFVEGANPAYKPMLSSGWNAIELLARDPDRLDKKLIDSPFKVIGPPNFLTNSLNRLFIE